MNNPWSDRQTDRQYKVYHSIMWGADKDVILFYADLKE